MKLKFILSFAFLLLLVNISIAQSPEGTWKGTSICQIKSSPCHDEIIVYHVSKDSSGKFQVTMNKIVDGKEDFMGMINFSFDAKEKILLSVDSARNAKWEFKISGNQMKGTLIYKGNLYRIIDAKKD